MWKKKYNNKISQVDLDDDRLIGIQLQLRSGLYIFIIQGVHYLSEANFPDFSLTFP